VTCPIVSQITPTATTCSQFNSGTSPTLDTLQYSVKGNPSTINQINPGVFFYWVKVTSTTAGQNTFTINQSITSGNFTTPFTFASGSNVFTASCSTASGVLITQAASGNVTVKFNASAAGQTFIIGIKYDTSAVKGKAAPTPSTVTYSFNTVGVPGTTQGLSLVKK
jgi:hypothetical protein